MVALSTLPAGQARNCKVVRGMQWLGQQAQARKGGPITKACMAKLNPVKQLRLYHPQTVNKCDAL